MENGNKGDKCKYGETSKAALTWSLVGTTLVVAGRNEELRATLEGTPRGGDILDAILGEKVQGGGVVNLLEAPNEENLVVDKISLVENDEVLIDKIEQAPSEIKYTGENVSTPVEEVTSQAGETVDIIVDSHEDIKEEVKDVQKLKGEEKDLMEEIIREAALGDTVIDVKLKEEIATDEVVVESPIEKEAIVNDVDNNENPGRNDDVCRRAEDNDSGNQRGVKGSHYDEGHVPVDHKNVMEKGKQKEKFRFRVRQKLSKVVMGWIKQYRNVPGDILGGSSVRDERVIRVQPNEVSMQVEKNQW